MNIFTHDQIRTCIDLETDLEALLKNQQEAFLDFSQGLYEVPQPIQMHFQEQNGDSHIKVGYKKNDSIFVVKIANSFYSNPEIGLPSQDGAIFAFSQKTGQLQSIFYDGGFLTTLRTALAAAISASITPWKIRCIGIMGSGSLASLLLEILQKQYPTVKMCLWARDISKAQKIAHTTTEICPSITDLTKQADVIITATGSTVPIIQREDISKNTHIIALGADDCHKREYALELFENTDVVVTDSIEQAKLFGDTSHAIRKGILDSKTLIELGTLLQNPPLSTAQRIITDFSGIAAQDIAITKFIAQKLTPE